MSDYHFDPDMISPLPPALRERQGAVLEATDVPPPDTGGSRAATAEAVRRLRGQAVALAAELERLAGDVEECLAVYTETDDDVFLALELRMARVLS